MVRLRKVGGEREARAWLSAAQASGQSLGEWARARGIDGRSLNVWRVNLARRSASPPSGASLVPSRPSLRRPSRLVELVPSAASKSAPRYVIDRKSVV